MSEHYENSISLRAHSERLSLMLPVNAVGALRIKGEIEAGALKSVVERLRRRHALLAVRAVFDDKGVAGYETAGVGELSVRVVDAVDGDWLHWVAEELKTPFPIRKGPLIRLVLVRSEDHSHLLVTGHHAIVDGVSHMLLMRDVLECLANPDRDVEVLPPPPPINATTVRSPSRAGRIERWIVSLVNRRWERQKLLFGEGDRERLHETYWRKNEPVVLAWDLPSSKTAALSARCRKKRVLVNSALWAAFLAAQHEVQGDTEAFRRQVAMPISTRGKLSVPVGEVIGFYASALTTELKHDPDADFWDAARKIQRTIHRALKTADLFALLKVEALNPGLLDSIYFAKYGLIENRMSDRWLRRLRMDKMSYGFTMSYLDGGDLPTEYGPITIEALYGFVYSDLNEKVVAVTKVGGQMSFTLVCNAEAMSPDVVARIRDRTMELLEQAAS